MKKNAILYLITLFILSISSTILLKYCVYPISVNFSKSSTYKIEWVLSNLDRISVDNPFFFDTVVPIGLEKYEILQMDSIPTVLKYNDYIVDASIKYYYDSPLLSGKVEGVHITFPYAQDIENEIISFYGKKYIKARRNSLDGKRIFKVWCTDKYVVILEHKNEKLYMSIKNIGLGWRREVAYGAYVKEIPFIEDVNLNEFTQLSFQGITLGKHIKQTEHELNNNPNISSYSKISESQYVCAVSVFLPNHKINLNTRLTFYRDTLTEIYFTSEDAAEELMSLYERKYEISDSLIHQNLGEWKDYKRDIRFYFDWKSRNQTLSVVNSMKEYSTLGVVSNKVSVSYRQSALYKSMMQEKEIQQHIRFKEEIRKKEQEARERELKLQQEITNALKQI